jgi:hypothetical protein
MSWVSGEVKPGARLLCAGCGAPREIESESPGVTKYKPCARCGAIAIRWNTPSGLRGVVLLPEGQTRCCAGDVGNDGNCPTHGIGNDGRKARAEVR